MYNETNCTDKYAESVELSEHLQKLITVRNKLLEGEITIPESLLPAIDKNELVVKCSKDIRSCLENMLDIEQSN